MTETLKDGLQKLHDICKGNQNCKTCPLNSEVSTCFAGMPPVAWTDKEIGKIIEVVQALEQEPTTKNDLALLEKTYDDFCKCEGGEGWLKIDGKEYATDAGYAIEGVDIFMEVFKRRLAELPSVTSQEPQSFKWCTDCREYDQEKHCCHRWSKVIRDTVEEMKQEQEPKTGH